MSAADTPAMVLQNVTRIFGERVAVKQLSLEVYPGEVVGILGPNGAGKSTTLRMLAGLFTPTSGHVEVCGHRMTENPEAAKKCLGFMTASTALYERLTGKEQLELFGTLYGMSKTALAQRLEALTQELGLGPFLNLRAGALSSGQKQRLSIARAVVHDPPAYVLDEPTSTLDPLAASAILNMVKDARRRGKAVLFSTHRMEEAEFLCDRLYFLREGSLVAHGTVAALCAQSQKKTFTETFLYFAQGQGREAA